MSNSLNKLPFEDYDNVFNSLKAGIGILIKDGSLYYANDEFCNMLGYDRHELVGKDLDSIFNKLDIELDYKKVFKILSKENGSYKIEKQFFHKNGDVLWLQFNFSNIKMANGEADYVIISLNDITEQKNAENELIFSEEKSRAFSDATNEAVFFTDKGVCFDCNTFATQMFGYSYNEFMGMFATNVIAPESQELVKQNMFSGYTEPYEGFARRKDGSVFWAEFQGRMSPYKGKEIRVSTIRDISYRKALENEQKASELNYRLLFENMNEAFALHKIIVNNNGEPIDYTYLDANPVYERLTGIKTYEVIGKNVLEVLPNLEKYWIDVFGKVALTGEPTQYTNYVAELNKYFETRVYSPEKGYFAVAFTDVTEKRNTENEVALHNKRLESLVRLSQVNVSNYIELIHKTISEAITLINGSCGSFYYYNTLEDNYKLINCILDNQEPIIDEVKMVELFQQSLQSKKPMLWNESALSDYLGSHTNPFKSLICIPANSVGIVTLVFGVASKNIVFTEVEKRHLALLIDSALLIIEKQKYQDQILTEKIKAEINESRFFEIQKAGKIGWYEALLDEGLFLGSYETYNVFFDEYYDYPVTAEHLISALHPDDREHFFNTVRNNIELKSPEFDWEYRVITPKNGVKYVYSKAFLKFDDSGKLIRRHGIVQDITEKKQIELELMRHNERLEKYQYELIHAKEKAEESDNLKSAFLANMSHEIRTPMNGIIGFSDLLVQENTSADKRQNYAKIVIECGKQLLTIVDDILDISKIEVGQVAISLEPVSVNDVITSMFSFFSPKAKDSNISLFPYKDLSDELALISSDKQRLVQILNNLLSNAFKFTLYGEISFGYYLKNEMLEFYVKDTGTGIAENMQGIVFERFRQAEQSNIRNYRGTGLGLSISQKLIELLGGKIWLESELGKGSTFYFTLPYQRVTVSGEALKTSKIKATETQLTILIAEDEEINLFYVNEVLSKAGVKLLHAKNGLEAVDLCKSHAEIALVLMDIKMPEMDGLLATEEIRKFRFELPIIAVTAFAMITDKERAFLAGCTDYISKPLIKSQLLEMIGKYIKMPG